TGRLQLLVLPNSELFGPLDKILSSFPFIDYRTADDSYSPQTRKLRFHDKIILEPYENSFIPQALADSIISLSCSLYGNECITSSASFVYGARPYTRRPINRDKVFSSFLDAIYRLADSESRIVLDISSTLYSKGHDYYPPEDQIEELVHDLTEIGSKEYPSIDILPLVSCPVLKTICILSKSNFGVYEWGANLTWYSWLLRKPVIALAPPSVLQKLNDTHSSLQAWGSFFWESDSPIPLLPNTQLVPKVCDDGQLNTFRFAPDDYSVDIGSFCRLAEQAFLRDQR
ncbi:hypothetical protein, partial [Cyanobium sp. N5-Cardenillas]|uniref:hypothetical protein n=1 Tax=Cyanobium sp. N5-Cardenillas TaxID=2823720 RepID=UPI0020CE6B1E